MWHLVSSALVALSWFEVNQRVIFCSAAPSLHAQPKGMRCIEVALRYSLVQASAGPEITLNLCVCTCMCACMWIRISILRGLIVSLMYSSKKTELIRFNLAAQPLALSLNIFFIPSQPPSLLSTSFFSSILLSHPPLWSTVLCFLFFSFLFLFFSYTFTLSSLFFGGS